jgi:hypothetical protein
MRNILTYFINVASVTIGACVNVMKPGLLRLGRGKHARSQIGIYQRKTCRIVLDPDLR